jgi:hypothetical protein
MSSKFLRVIALSKTPADFRKKDDVEESHRTVGPAPAIDHTRDTVSSVTTVPSQDTESLQGTVSPKAQRVYRCLTAQDGHSFAEDRLYNSLWNYRQARMDTNEYRLVTAGWDLMAKLSGMTPRNAKENCFRLVAKLALEKVQAHNSDQRIGATYRVYSYAAIIRRRREAGLEWITRNRGGVAFVQPARETRDTVPSKATVSSQDRGTVSSEGTPLSQGKVKEKTSTSTSGLALTRDTVPLIAAAIASPAIVVGEQLRRLLTIDDDAVARIVASCQKAQPDATGEEIAYFAEIVIAKHSRNPKVSNLVGLMIGAVAKYFEHPASELIHYREEKKRARERQEQCASEVLADPESTDTDREWARSVIAARTMDEKERDAS